MRHYFEEWLIKNDNKKKNSAYSYTLAIPRLSEHYSNYLGHSVDLFNSEGKIIRDAISIYKQDGKFSEFGNTGNGTYRNALNALLRMKESTNESDAYITNLIRMAIAGPELEDLINAREFYFQHLLNVKDKFFEYSISKLEIEEIIKDYEDYKDGTFEDFVVQSDDSVKPFLELLAEYISYLDKNASGKNRWNKYPDKRAIALAFVRMPFWVRGLLNVKANPDFKLKGSIKNAIDYSISPMENLTVLSENHRKDLSNKLLKKVYNDSTFQEEIFEYFKSFGLEPKNKMNYTFIISSILYSREIKSYWNSNETREIDLDEDINTRLSMINEDVSGYKKRQPLNQILYGPPGTGKTFQLQDKYFERFTIRESSLSRKQFLLNSIADKTWWQVLSMAVLDLGNSRVDEIMNHELVGTKISLGDSKLPRNTIWGTLQAHTLMECPNVGVKDRSNIQLFWKDENSHWKIIEDNLEEQYPDAISILESIKNYKPDSATLIKNYEFVTFHQSFSYEDFVEGIKPRMEEEDSELHYEITDGVFKRLALRANADPENDYAIFIDEINRGNVSAIFGELITLIEEDKRAGGKNPLSVKLPYSKKEFEVPSNLYVFGTMNTADRSVEALDTALRRRFSFKEIMPNPSLLKDIEFDSFYLNEVLETINERIEYLLDRDHTIGHSYFMGIESGDTEALKEVFKNKVIPLLQEYFYHDYEKIALILGPGFVNVKTNHVIEFPSFAGISPPDNVTLCELLEDIEDIEQAVRLLLNRDEE